MYGGLLVWLQLQLDYHVMLSAPPLTISLEDVNGKPDVYGLISCAAFAVMSLSLSRQSHLGFEVDLLYFFLGALIVQFMKIHLFLGIFGVGLSYSLIILRSSLDLENEHQRLDDQYHSVVQVDSDSQQQQEEAAQVDSDSQEVNTDIVIMKTQFTACINALKLCDRELINMLSNYAKDNVKTFIESNLEDHVPVDSNMVIDALPSNIIDDLREGVKFMVANGLQKECCDSYSSCRREYLEKFISSSNLKLPNIVNVVEVESTALEFQVRNWITTSNLAMRLLFPNERRLCERIFMGLSTATDIVFTEICREFTIHQFKFSGCFTFEVFPMSTGKATKGIFIELEDWICNDEAISDVPDELYPICRKVIECLNVVFKAWVILPLENFFEEHPMVVHREGSPSSFFIQLIRIIELLEKHLEVRFKSCPDRALRCITAMNNVRHIEQNAKKWNWDTRPMYNSGIIRKLSAKVRQNLEDYLRISWDDVVGLLKLGDNEAYSAESMKENLKLFNLHFKEICRVQSTWFVLDEQLRKEIRESIDNILLPIYGVFIGKLYDVLGSHANEYIEYSMLDIDALLNDLFRA
ncbi:Exocyst complex component [Arachis hypogaea]|nr:Exocyst complex component [Arachis hypogaea]